MIPLPPKRRPLVVYFHRYPPEYEAVQHPAMRAMFDEFLTEYDVLYFSMKGVVLADPQIRQGIRVKEIPLRVDVTKARDKWLKTFFYYLLLPVTLWRLRAEHPDFIICKETMPFVPSLVGLLRIPMSIDACDWWWSILLGKWKLGRAFAQKMENIEIHHWNKPSVTVVAYTTREAESLKKRGLSAENVRIVNAPLYRGVYQPCDASLERHKLGFTKDDFVATVHGIIDSRKGYDQLFEWWTKLVAIHPNWKLLVIGGAGNEQWCRKTIQKLRMEENIIMTGWLPSQSDVNRHLNAADCLLVTRKNTPENLGLIPSALFHNLAVGKPTVATALPGISEIISHGVNGYLYQPDSFESFKSLLEFISQNPEVAKKIAKTGRERAEECFSPEAAAVKYFALIRETFQRLSPKAGIAGFHDAMEKRRS